MEKLVKKIQKGIDDLFIENVLKLHAIDILKRYFEEHLGIFVDGAGNIYIYVPNECSYFTKITREEAETIREIIGGDIEVYDTSGLEEKSKTLKEFLEEDLEK